MRRLTFLVAIMAVLGVAASVSASAMGDEKAAESKMPVTNKACPIMGGAVSAKVRIEHDGQWVYFCCPGCIDAFKADPAASIAKMSDEDRAAIQKNKTCPMSGEEITAFDVRSELDGKFVYFCCAMCKGKFDKQHPTAK
jgi:YHS domain-containing protein